MGNETVYDVAVIDNRRPIDSAQTVVEARMMADGEISKVLSVSATVSVSSAETLFGEARYRGKVNYKVLYLDGTTVRALDYVSDFSGAVSSEVVKTGSDCAFKAEVLDIDVSAVTSSEIKAAAVVEVTLILSESENVRYLSFGGESIYTQDERLNYLSQNDRAVSTFTLTDELENAAVKNVVSADAKAFTNIRKAGDDQIEVSGEVICDLVCEGEDGLLVSYRTSTPFTEVLISEGTQAGDAVVADVTIDSVRVNLTEGETALIEIAYEMQAAAYSYAEKSINIFTDAFCVENELQKTIQKVDVIRSVRQQVVNETLDGSVTLKDEMPPADNILAVCGAKAIVTGTSVDSGRVLASGMVTGNIIYYCAENNSISSASIELPFSVLLSVPAGDHDRIDASADIYKVNVRIRRGNELDIRAEVCFDVTLSESETVSVLSGLELGEARIKPESAFSVYIARPGDTLWDVAKELGVTPEAVVASNPDIGIPLSGGERVLAYRHLAR